MQPDDSSFTTRIFVGAVIFMAVTGLAFHELGDRAAGPEAEGAASSSASGTPLERMASGILAKVAAQESKQDATCWTTVRMIESFSIGRQLTPAAEVGRIEGSRLLLHRLWRHVSEQTRAAELSEKDVAAALPGEVASEPPGSGVVDGAAIPVDKLELKDHQRTTENWRTLLSLVLDATARHTSPDVLRPFDPSAAEALARASTTLTGLLLRESGRFAKERNHDRAELEDVQSGYQVVAARVFGATTGDPAKPAPGPSLTAEQLDETTFASLRRASETMVLGKVHALRRYNMLGDAESYDDTGMLAKYLSDVVRFPVTVDGAAALRKELQVFAEMFLSAAGPFRSDTFANSMSGLAAEKEDPKRAKEKRFIRVSDIFNAAQNLFPTHKLANGDSEVYMTRNIVKDPQKPSEIEERRAQLFAPSLDAIRDTGIHWMTLKHALESRPNVAIDPFAAELLTEDLSEYAFFLLKEAVELARSRSKPAVSEPALQFLEWKYPLGRFFPDPKTQATPGGIDPKLRDDLKARYKGPLFREHKVGGEWSPSCTVGRSGFQGFMGSGFAVGDFDGDGKTDLFLAADGCNRLLKNEGHYRFTDVTARWGVTGLGSSSRHPIFVDVDGDGRLDLFVVQSDAPSKLFLQKDHRFVDVTAAYGLSTGKGAHEAHFFDYDHDGDLDLFVGTYGPSVDDTAVPTLDGRNGYPNELWRNEDGARFVNVTKAAGVESTAWTLASAAVDIDQDGWLDFWLANDWGKDEVFRNRGDGTFEEVAEKLRVDDRGSGMNVSILDINHDGKADVFVSVIDMFSKTLRFVLPREDVSFNVDDRIIKSSYYMSGNKLFVAKDGGFADETTARVDARDKGWAWGTVFFDYENDGDDDMYIVNGWIDRSAFYKQRHQFLINEKDKLISWSPGITEAVTDESQYPESYLGSSRAVAAVDLDGKGSDDLVVLDYEHGLRVFENRAPARGHFVRVRLEGGAKNKLGIGAAVRVFAPDVPPIFRMANAGGDYLAEAEIPLLFGIGQADHADRVVVRWASGRETEIKGPFAAGSTVVVREADQ